MQEKQQLTVHINVCTCSIVLWKQQFATKSAVLESCEWRIWTQFSPKSPCFLIIRKTLKYRHIPIPNELPGQQNDYPFVS